MNRSSAAVTALATLAIVGSAVLTGTGSVLAASHDLTIVDFAFEPARLTVLVGEPVTWTNTSTRTHTVTSDEGTELNGSSIGAGQAYDHVFGALGTYAYHCDIHRQMTGTVVVEAASATATPSGSPGPTPPSGTTGGGDPQLLVLEFIGAALLGVIVLIVLRRRRRSEG